MGLSDSNPGKWYLPNKCYHILISNPFDTNRLAVPGREGFRGDECGTVSFPPSLHHLPTVSHNRTMVPGYELQNGTSGRARRHRREEVVLHKVERDVSEGSAGGRVREDLRGGIEWAGERQPDRWTTAIQNQWP